MVTTKKGYSFMRILGAVISAITLLFSLSACSSYPHQNWLGDDSMDKIAKKRCTNIVSALTNNDKEAIKSMFSKQAIEEIENLDESITYAINYYKGKFKSLNGTISTEENLNGKNKKITIKADYTVTTDVETYSLFFVEKSNTENSDENGLYLFQLAKESEAEKVQGYLDAGIYVPKE